MSEKTEKSEYSFRVRLEGTSDDVKDFAARLMRMPGIKIDKKSDPLASTKSKGIFLQYFDLSLTGKGDTQQQIDDPHADIVPVMIPVNNLSLNQNPPAQPQLNEKKGTDQSVRNQDPIGHTLHNNIDAVNERKYHIKKVGNRIFAMTKGSPPRLMNRDSTSFLHFSMAPYWNQLGYVEVRDQTSACYKMENLTETEDEYIVPVVMAAAMVQPFHTESGTMYMAKLPKDIEESILVDYESGELVDRIPIFEEHPETETRDKEIGYVDKIKYQNDKERLVGWLHVKKSKLSDVLKGMFAKKDQIGVSIGYMYVPGPGGNFRGKDYLVAQTGIIITHLAIFGDYMKGRCPKDVCAVGKKL